MTKKTIGVWILVVAGVAFYWLAANHHDERPRPPEPVTLTLICDQPPIVETKRLEDAKGYQNENNDLYEFTIKNCRPDIDPADFDYDPR